MAPDSYCPPRDDMIAIRRAAERLRGDALRWHEFHKYPNCPVEIGNLVALRALFDLERTLNPHYYPFDHAGRQLAEPVAWDLNVVGGLYWIRNLNDELIRRLGVETFSTAESFARWRQLENRLPETVSISIEELEEFRLGIELLEPIVSSGDVLMRTTPKAEPRRLVGSESSDTCLVRYTTRGDKFWINDREVDRTTTAQFHVIKALKEAGPEGLSLEALRTDSDHPDASAILDRLLAKDPDNWGQVIIKAGAKGNNYRLAFGNQYLPEATHTEKPAATRSDPHHP